MCSNVCVRERKSRVEREREREREVYNRISLCLPVYTCVISMQSGVPVDR